MEGYRTYAYVIVTTLGWLGIGGFVSTGQIAQGIDLVVQLIGLVGTVYYNHQNHVQIDVLKGVAGVK